MVIYLAPGQSFYTQKFVKYMEIWTIWIHYQLIMQPRIVLYDAPYITETETLLQLICKKFNEKNNMDLRVSI